MSDASTILDWQDKIRKIRHDVRSAAGKIMGFGQLLREDIPGPEFADLRQDLQVIVSAGGQLVEQCNHALNNDHIRDGQVDVPCFYVQSEALIGLMSNTCNGLVQKAQVKKMPEFVAEVQRIVGFVRDLSAFLAAIHGLGSALDFRITRLPASSTEKAIIPGIYPGNAKVILVVDDQDANRELLQKRLNRLGYKILMSVNGQEALEVIHKIQIDLVLLDIVMPVLDGIETLKRLKANQLTTRLPVIMLSAENDTSTIADCIHQGAEDFIPKPFDSDILMARIGSALAKNMALDQLRQSHEQMRALALRIETVREDERSQIARDLHDDLGQVLTGLKLDLAWVTNRLPSEQVVLRERCNEMSGRINTIIQKVRTISSELRPGMLDDLGLSAAIEWQAQDFERRFGIGCRLKCDDNLEDLDMGRTTALYRILQEALTNVLRHAEATKVHICLKRKSDHVFLEVKDNGQGISSDALTRQDSLGLLSMRERAFAYGGKVRITGDKGKGTLVSVRIPLMSSGKTDAFNLPLVFPAKESEAFIVPPPAGVSIQPNL